MIDTKSIDKSIVEKSLCERGLRYFIECAWSQVVSEPFIGNWHIDLICKELEAITEGDYLDLLVNVPPGTSKSLITCVFWPAWVWGPRNWPSSKWFFASYSDELTTRDSVHRRNLMQTPWYQAKWGDRVAFNKDQNLKTRYSNNAGGEMMSSSVGGAGLGEHPSFLIIDDPIKSNDAHSEKELENVKVWWEGTVVTRGVLKRSRRVVIMQRLDQRDLSGVIINSGRAKHVCLPMKFEKNHPFRCPDDPRTEEGELLWPAAFTPERLKQITSTMPAYTQAGQLQQRPTAEEGGMFKRQWFRYYQDRGDHYELRYDSTETREAKTVRVQKRHCWRFAVADTATTEKEMNDPTAIAVFDVERRDDGENRMFLIEMLVFHAETPEVKRILKSLIAKYGLLFIGVEDTLDGKHYIQQFKREGIPIKSIRTDGKDKVTRAIPMSIDMENEQLWFAANAPWLASFEDQLLLFPNAAHDDQVDCCAHACNAARNKDYSIPEKEKGVKVKINGVAEVIKPGTMGWVAGLQKVFAPKTKSLFKKGAGEKRSR